MQKWIHKLKRISVDFKGQSSCPRIRRPDISKHRSHRCSFKNWAPSKYKLLCLWRRNFRISKRKRSFITRRFDVPNYWNKTKKRWNQRIWILRGTFTILNSQKKTNYNIIILYISRKSKVLLAFFDCKVKLSFHDFIGGIGRTFQVVLTSHHRW